MTTILGICASVLTAIGLFGLIALAHPLRKLISFNVAGSGIFLLFGVIAKRGAAAGAAGDPVPQALVITGIVVAFSATALGIAILLRYFDETGRVSLKEEIEDITNRDKT